MTLAERARAAAATLAAAGVPAEDSRRDVALLARSILGWDAADWLTRQQDSEPAGFAERLGALTARRAAQEPVAYILGEREFYGRPFSVSSDVLIPRPETEILIEAALDALAHPITPAKAPRVLDVGTGSGAIAITIALEHPASVMAASDVSEPALAVARRNAERHGVRERIDFVQQSLIGPMRNLDLIVSNPPYVRLADRESLPRDVRDHEPALALFGGSDGLAIITTLIHEASGALKPGGGLILEIGATQSPAVEALVRAAGLEWVETRRDLAGIDRIVVAKQPLQSI